MANWKTPNRSTLKRRVRAQKMQGKMEGLGGIKQDRDEQDH